MQTDHLSQKSSFIRVRPRQRIQILLAGDLLCAGFALFVALYIWALQDEWLSFSAEFIRTRTPLWYFFLPLIWVFLLLELYDLRKASQKRDTLRATLMAAFIALVLYLFVYFLFDENTPLPRLAIGIFIPMVALFTFAWRLLYISVFTARPFLRRILILGAGKTGRSILEIIRRTRTEVFHIIGFIDDKKQNELIEGIPVVGNRHSLEDIVGRFGVTDIICAINKNLPPDLLEKLTQFEENGIEVTTASQVYEELTGRIPIHLHDTEWLIRTFYSDVHSTSSYILSKRVIDFFAGVAGTIGFILLLPIISLAIVVESGFPIFIKQERVGKNGQPYTLIKFRSMYQAKEKSAQIQPTLMHDQRITLVGKVLRKSHLDEIPQFLAILQGKMSLIGPRAEITSLVSHFQKEIPFYRARLLAKPGLTGWAQVHQSYAATVEETVEKLEYDLFYIKHRSLLLDMQIIVRSISQVLGLRGR
ncbi:MAG TPA: exopolysaccharide biosynthesis polyprenyl glycosylphosphotransferase [Chloroflexi bacterium]|nr:exopolysaccharide biosynthesis polyprenyl glycosylphosphotransferase [Chloroflexota bacterium]